MHKLTPIKKKKSRKPYKAFVWKVDVGLPASLMVYPRNYAEIKEDP